MAVLDTMRTDIMHKAAVTIQRHVRGFMVRRQTQRIRRAVIKLQVPTLSMSAMQCLACESGQYALENDDRNLQHIATMKKTSSGS